MTRALHLSLISAAGFLPAVSLSQDEGKILPTSYPVSRYTEVWDDSPFNREVVRPVEQTITSSFAKTLVLEGIVNDDTLGPIAYVRDTAEDKPIVITSTARDGHPFTIVSANLVNNPEETTVTVTDGSETGEIRYVAAKLTQAIVQPPPQAPQGTNPAQNPAARERDKGRAIPPTPPGAVGSAPGGGGGGGVRTDEAPKPASAAPALDALDSEPRRRRVPLPGN